MNFSIVILYSHDRKTQLQNSLECLSECKYYNNAEKIIISDGKSNFTNSEWNIFEFLRSKEFYCWADTLNFGVSTAKNKIIIYMDSDRILPKNFFELCFDKIENNSFIYPKNLYKIKKHCSFEELKTIRDNFDNYKNLLEADHRHNNPYKQVSGTNPFSGCVCFYRDDFINHGGFDDEFIGWGYPDSDFFMKTTKHGCKFISLDINELHQKHDRNVLEYEFELHNIFNLKKYCDKWSIETNEIIEKCNKHKIKIDDLYSSKTLKEFLFKASKKNKLI